MQRKKPNKQKREKIRTEKANEHLVSFNHGYEMGYAQAKKDLEKELKEWKNGNL